MEAAASIIGLVAIGLKVYVTLECFVSTCKDAPEIAKITRDEVRDFWYALHRLRPYVERTAQITPLGAAATDTAQLSLTLGSCMVTFSEVEKLLDRLLPKPEMNYIGRVRWTVSGASLAQLIKRIQQHKHTLNLMLTIWMSESSAQTEHAIDVLNDLLRDLLDSKEEPTTADLAAQVEAVTSLHGADTHTPNNGPPMSLGDDNASILTTSTSLTARSRHSLKSILLKTKLYSDPKLFENSGFSISTSRRRGTPWSEFTVGSNTSVFSLPFTDFQGTGLSIAEEGDVSQINIPVNQRLLYRPSWYPNIRPLLTSPSTSYIRNQGIRRSKGGSRPVSIPPRPELGEDDFDLIDTSDMEEVSEVILSGRDLDGEFLCYVANKSAILSEMILDRAFGESLELGVVHPLLNAAIRAHRWDIIDQLFRRNQIPETGLIDSNWRQVTLQYAAENIHISQALCKGPMPATSLASAIVTHHSDGLAPLAFAAKKGNVNMVRFLLNNGADVLENSPSGVTALHCATVPPINLEILKMLIDGGADIKSLYHGRVPLLNYLITHYLKQWGPNVLKVFLFILAAGCSASLTDHHGTNALIHAVINGDWRVVQFLLDYSGPDLDLETKDRDGDTALHKSLIYHKDGSLAALLIERGANVNTATQDGITPLIMCLTHNGKQSHTVATATFWRDTVLPLSCIPLLEMMVTRGADINAQGPKGITPLIQAINCHDPQLDPMLVRIHFVIESGASLSTADDLGDSALIHAVRKGDLKLLRLLWMSGADLEWVNKSGRTALHEALLENSVQVVELLLERGADIAVKAADGSAPLLFFCRNHYYNHSHGDVPCHADEEHIKMLNLLLDHGADVSAIAPEGESVLHHLISLSRPALPLLDVLAARGFLKSRILLLTRNYDPLPDQNLELLTYVLGNVPPLSITEAQLNSALLYATSRDHLGSMRLLIEKGAGPDKTGSFGRIIYAVAKSPAAAKILLDATKAQLNGP